MTEILENYITVSEFAEEARITSQTVRKRIKKGQLVARKMGHQYLIQEKELYEYLLNKRKGSDGREEIYSSGQRKKL